ncbi:NAD-dependent epimerase/dehydratase family protein [Sphingobacterium sp. HJSM2_6]|uniref:NAD-dependent epimerase/dehydratase family protein n=1 Tax=Sphingobacterium sp. HJSM2_6 TaxID=3366264 RepID=UPI003BC439DE
MILVTGGTGFLGSTLLQNLIDTGQSVIAIKRFNSHIPEQLKSSSLIQWVDAEITDYFALAEIFPQIKQVYHCAAKVSYQKVDAAEMFNTNIQGTKHIVNLCIKHAARLVHVSSIAALGTNKLGLPVKETDKWETLGKIANYSKSKYESEMEVWRGIEEGLEAVIINPSVIMGVGFVMNGSRKIFDLVQKGNKIYTAGSVGIVDVQDVVRVMIQLMHSPIRSERFIVNAENISNKDLLIKISQLMKKPEPRILASAALLSIAWRLSKLISLVNGKKPTITAENAQAANTKLMFDNSKIIQTLGVSFKPIDEILREVCKTYYL